MRLYHGTESNAVQEITGCGISPPDDYDELVEVLDSHRPEKFPARSDSVFFSPVLEVVSSYERVVVIESGNVPHSIPCYIGNRRIADEVSFLLGGDEWGFGGDVEGSAKKYWKYAELVDGTIPDDIGVDDEVVYGGVVPPEAIIEVREEVSRQSFHQEER